MDSKFSSYTPARNQSNAVFMVTLCYEPEIVSFLYFTQERCHVIASLKYDVFFFFGDAIRMRSLTFL